jgi:DNA-binding response OmpR family regulator
VESDPLMSNLLRDTLSDAHDVQIESDPVAVLWLLAAGRSFDLIICRFMLPNMTAMDLQTMLARERPEQATRMLFMTAGTFPLPSRYFVEHSGGGYSARPFRADQIREQIDAWFASHGLLGHAAYFE